jgi:hypothetical protein
MPSDQTRSQPRRKTSLSPEKYARLKAEAKAPYRGLRQFIYATFATSGLIGAFIFLAKLASGEDITTTLGNLAVQIGVIALMVWLYRLENRK